MFAFLLFNLVHLEPGEALYTPAGVPHAYLGGNIIECMASSDNVVRVGLTPKFKDTATLLDIIDTTPQTPRILDGCNDSQERIYKTPAQEFELTRWSLADGMVRAVEEREGPAILILTAGSTRLTWKSSADEASMLLKEGDSVLIPHLLKSYALTVVDGPAEVFRTTVPYAVRFAVRFA